MKWSGQVSKVSSRDWGSKTIYSWQLEGTNQWFRAETDPKIEEGQWVEFSGESAQKVDVTTMTATTSDAVKSEAKAAASTKTGDVPPSNSPDYWRWKQMRDLSMEKKFDWRDARHDATRIICAALDNGVLALGSSQGKKLGLIKGYVNELTRELIEEMYNDKGE
jgi:hypothetical protein